MKKKNVLPALLLGASLFGLPKALGEVIITLNDGHIIRVEKVENIAVNEGGDGQFVVTYADGSTETFSITDIERMTFGEKDFSDVIDPTPAEDPNIITIVWNGTAQPEVVCSAPGVEVSIDGGNVFVTNTNVDTEYTYVLRGASTNGSFTLTADYKSVIRLEGLTLNSSLEEALNIKCGKRVALVVADGTTNTLTDAAVDNGQKAALYCKGHLEVEGAGTLNLTGNVKHAVSTKEYLQLKKKFTGQLNVLAAASDGIHAGQYFQMNAGNVSIKGVKGDGIQAEMTSNAEDEQNGQIIVKDGVIDITTTATDVAAMKSDTEMSIEGGTFSLTTSGAGDKALKSKTNISITGGDFTIKQSGKPCIEAGDLGYVTAVKGVDVTVSGGTFDINVSGTAGRGFSADNLTISNAANVKLVNTAVSGTAADAVEVTTEPDPTPDPDEQETPKSYKIYVNLPTSSSGGGGRPGGQSSNAWTTVALYNSNGTLVSNVSSTVNVNGTTFYYYDFKEPTSGTFYFGNPNGYSSGYTTYTIKTSTFSGPADGKDHYYRAATSYSTSGSTRTYNLTDVTSQYEGGTIGGGTSTSGDVITAKGIKVDKDLHLTGGIIDINMSGKGGKGIKVDGNAYVGDQQTGEGPILSIVTSGAAAGGGTTSGGGGWPGGGGFGGESGGGGTTKAFKITGSYYQYGGNLYVNTASAEGIESKTKSATSMNFNGGSVYLYCSDDCINSAGAINFGGAHVMAISFNNDAIDSNYGQSNSLVVTDGTVLAFSTRGGAEMGFDCDANNRISFTGGTLVAGGGQQGGSSSASLGTGSVHYKVWSASISYTANNYNTVTCGGKGVFTFCLPVACNSSYNFYACSDFSSNQTHSLVRNTTAPTEGTPILFRTSATDLVGKPLFWRPTNVTSGTSMTTFSPN